MTASRRLAWCLGVALLASCPGYAPTLTDCKVKCSTTGTCPEGLVCKTSFCRPATAVGGCDCTPGDTQVCGGGKGECTPGQKTCNNGIWGPCVGEGKPMAETCDNKDNDCNGTVDDFVGDAPPCPLTKGVCAGNFQVCTAGTFSGTCALSAYGSDYEPIETRCDGKDNDCDGLIDATLAAPLLTQISHYVLTSSDGGFSLVGNLDRGTGTHQVVLLPLTGRLTPAGTMVTVSSMLPVEQVLAARSSGPTTFIAWADDAVDAGVHLSAVASSGTLTSFLTYFGSEKTGPLSMGVSGTQVFVTWPAHFAQAVRLVTWETADGGISSRDFGTLDDGGFLTSNEYTSSRLSDTARAIGWVGNDNDGGVDAGVANGAMSISFVRELQGTKSAVNTLSPSFELVEVGPKVQTAWSYSDYFPIPLNLDESGLDYQADVFTSSAENTFKLFSDHTVVTGGAIGRGLSTTVLGWIERRTSAVIATPLPGGTQLRQRTLPGLDGGVYDSLQFGNTGNSALVAVTWRDTLTGPGTISGVMVCQP